MHVVLAVLQLASVRLAHAEISEGHRDNLRRTRQRGYAQYGVRSGRYLTDHDNVFVRSNGGYSESTFRHEKGTRKKARGKSPKSKRSPPTSPPMQALPSKAPTRAPSTGMPVQALPTISPISPPKAARQSTERLDQSVRKAKVPIHRYHLQRLRQALQSFLP
jgi:hypothetical protein